MADFTGFVRAHGGLDHVTYIDGGWSGSNGWHTIYRCLTLVMKMRLPVKGYLQIGEDVLLNSRSVASLPRDKVWILDHFSRRNVSVPEDTYKWYHWSMPWGRQALLSLFTQMQTSANFAPSPLENNRDVFIENVSNILDPTFFLKVKHEITKVGSKNVMVMGDSNLLLNPEIDGVNYKNINNKKARAEVGQTMADLDLFDIWREKHPEGRKNTWKRKLKIHKSNRKV
ncbi:hypothetical protein ElyMa_005302100 [Elysia marginata]|uniref:Uncharacterized protein n=1 Tax=Elysia marginata TaxID=1093978 RepID=A0AAV4JZK1_9GAST|nr:hypothetical protein ElyMa_005302100 [Elysia marginata]